MSSSTADGFRPEGDPQDRPWRFRTAVRVILINADDCVLLFQDSDPGISDVRWWVTPGGGIDPGESELEAAVREVREETGYTLEAVDLRGPIARRVAVHGYSDQVLEQTETFFIAHVPNFEVDTSEHTEDEQLTLQGSHWWSRAELAGSDAWIWPAQLLELWDLDPSAWPLDLGRQDESTRAVVDTHS